MVWSPEPTDEFGCGDTPEEVMILQREKFDSKKWMEHLGCPFVYVDASHSFLAWLRLEQ